MDPSEPQWTWQEGMDYEVAKAILWDQMGKRTAAIYKLAPGDDETKARLRAERSAFHDLAHDLDIHDARRVGAILRGDFEEAFSEGFAPGA